MSEQVLILLGGELRLPWDDVLSLSYAKPGDVVVVCGTLVEGLGNRYSDIDIYVIGDRLPAAAELDLERHHRVIDRKREIVRESGTAEPVSLVHTVVPGTSIKVDVEYRTFADIHKVFGEVRAIYAYATKNLVLLTKRLAFRDESMIHRLFNGIAIRNEGQFAELMKGIDRDDYRYLAYRWFASDFSVLLDVLGAADAGDWERAADLARENLITQMGAYLHLHGATNFRRKWILRLFPVLPEVDSDLHSRFRELYFFPHTTSDRARREYVESSLDFVDELYARGISVIERCRRWPSGEEALALLARDRDMSRDPSDYGRMEYTYRAKAYRRDSEPTKSWLRRGHAAVERS